MGAWETSYHLGVSADITTPLGMGICAIKRELAFNGYDKDMVLALPLFGHQVRESVVAFQSGVGLAADGIVGPLTARRLWGKRCRQLEATNGIPGALLRRLKTLESANDPAAVGSVDADDHGLVQINIRIHAGFSVYAAHDPKVCLPWAASVLTAAHKDMQDWDAAVASWNTGVFYARLWMQAGKPESGLVRNEIDWFARAHRYVALVKRQPL